MFKRILTPIDLDERAAAARVLQASIRTAEAHDSELHVLVVVPDFSMSLVGGFFAEGHEEKMLSAARTALAGMLAGQSAEIKGHVARGTIYEQIITSADTLQCDLIVMGAHRPALKDYLLGPNAGRVVRHARQSVFVVRD